jgi:hypothetical protein
MVIIPDEPDGTCTMIYRGFEIVERDGEWFAEDANGNVVIQAASEEKLYSAVDDYKRRQREAGIV